MNLGPLLILLCYSALLSHELLAEDVVCVIVFVCLPWDKFVSEGSAAHYGPHTFRNNEKNAPTNYIINSKIKSIPASLVHDLYLICASWAICSLMRLTDRGVNKCLHLLCCTSRNSVPSRIECWEAYSKCSMWDVPTKNIVCHNRIQTSYTFTQVTQRG